MHQRFFSGRTSVVSRTILPATILVAWMSATALPAAQRSDTEGLKETNNFLKAGSELSSALSKAKLQAQETLRAYNSLVTQPSADMKGDYKKLLKAAKDTDKRVDEARQQATKMEAAGKTYFSGRTATITAIQDAGLRDQAQQRLDQNQKEYASVMESLRETGQSLQTMRADLYNQITYVGGDLTPSAMTSLQPQAQKLNERGGELFAKSDQAIMTANNYFNSMRPTKS